LKADEARTWPVYVIASKEEVKDGYLFRHTMPDARSDLSLLAEHEKKWNRENDTLEK
jgi:hypothetical protein